MLSSYSPTLQQYLKNGKQIRAVELRDEERHDVHEKDGDIQPKLDGASNVRRPRKSHARRRIYTMTTAFLRTKTTQGNPNER